MRKYSLFCWGFACTNRSSEMPLSCASDSEWQLCSCIPLSSICSRLDSLAVEEHRLCTTSAVCVCRRCSSHCRGTGCTSDRVERHRGGLQSYRDTLHGECGGGTDASSCGRKQLPAWSCCTARIGWWPGAVCRRSWISQHPH